MQTTKSSARLAEVTYALIKAANAHGMSMSAYLAANPAPAVVWTVR